MILISTMDLIFYHFFSTVNSIYEKYFSFSIVHSYYCFTILYIEKYLVNMLTLEINDQKEETRGNNTEIISLNLITN